MCVCAEIQRGGLRENFNFFFFMVIEQANKQSSNQGTQQQKRQRIKKKNVGDKEIKIEAAFFAAPLTFTSIKSAGIKLKKCLAKQPKFLSNL